MVKEWGGEARKVKVWDASAILTGNVLSHCSIEAVSESKRNITEFFLYIIFFWWESIVLQGNGVNISGFVNQSNLNKQEFGLAQKGLKCFSHLFHK